MALNIYIFGNPYGFSSDGPDASKKPYFDSLYQTHHTGRRLLVNRRADGSTAYNFIVYGTISSNNRPNGLFGMSFFLDNNLYIGDFKVIYMLFNSVFEDICLTCGMFTPVGGTYKYTATSFDEMPVGLIRQEIGRRLSEANPEIRAYDSSFVDNNQGEVRLLNINSPQEQIVNSLRQARWVALSEMVPAQASNSVQTEVSIADIQENFTNYLSTAADIAIEPTAASKSKLDEIISFTNSTMVTVVKHITELKQSGTAEEKEITAATNLAHNLEDLREKAEKIINKLPTRDYTLPQPEPQPEQQPEPEDAPEAEPVATAVTPKPVDSGRAPKNNQKKRTAPKDRTKQISSKNIIKLLSDTRVLALIIVGIIVLLFAAFFSGCDRQLDHKSFQRYLSAGDYNECDKMLVATSDSLGEAELSRSMTDEINKAESISELSDFGNSNPFYQKYEIVTAAYENRKKFLQNRQQGAAPIQVNLPDNNKQSVTTVEAAVEIVQTLPAPPKQDAGSDKQPGSIWDKYPNALILVFKTNAAYSTENADLIMEITDPNTSDEAYELPHNDKDTRLVFRTRDNLIFDGLSRGETDKHNDNTLRVDRRRSDGDLTITVQNKQFKFKIK